MNELRDQVKRLFSQSVERDSRLKRLMKKIVDSGAYSDADEVAIRLGELMSEAMITSTADIDVITEELARELFDEPLAEIHQLVADVAKQIQENILAERGIGLRAVTPDLNADRIAGLVSKIASYEAKEDALWLLKEPIVNFSQSVVDNTIRKNMEANTKAGFRATVTRTPESRTTRSGIKNVRVNGKVYSYPVRYQVPCKWCRNMAGTYDYDAVKQTGADVWRRHEGCRCTLTYKLSGEPSEIVWAPSDSEHTKQKAAEKERQDAEKRSQQRKRLSNVQRVMEELKYSPKGASIFVNANKAEIDKYGIEYVIDWARNG